MEKGFLFCYVWLAEKASDAGDFLGIKYCI